MFSKFSICPTGLLRNVDAHRRKLALVLRIHLGDHALAHFEVVLDFVVLPIAIVGSGLQQSLVRILFKKNNSLKLNLNRRCINNLSNFQILSKNIELDGRCTPLR